VLMSVLQECGCCMVDLLLTCYSVAVFLEEIAAGVAWVSTRAPVGGIEGLMQWLLQGLLC